MAAISFPGGPEVAGPGHQDLGGLDVITAFRRIGFAVFPTVDDGDCGSDNFNMVEGLPRILSSRRRVRNQIYDVLVAHAAPQQWHEAFRAAQEMLVEVAASAGPAVAGTAVVAIARAAASSGCGSLAEGRGDQAAASGGPTASGGGDLAPGSRDGDTAESLSLASGTTQPEAALTAAVRWATGLPNPRQR